MDDYNHRHLRFTDSAPYPNEVITNPGLLRWYDLTGSPPYGFGRNLLPAEQFVVTTVFVIVADITTTVNTAVITGARDTGDNPADEDEDDEPIINIPTGIGLRYLRASSLEGGVRVEWATLVEVDHYGFELHRATRDRFAQATLLAFQPSRGGGSGAEYAYLDKDVESEQRYWYWLVELDNEDRRTRYGPVSATTGALNAWWHRVYLPVVLRR